MGFVFRNLFYTLRHFKAASFLNLVGLSVAFAVFIIVMMQVDYDYNFDRFHENSDRIYRVEYMEPDGTKTAVVSRPFAETICRNSPYVVAGGIMTYRGDYFFRTKENQTGFMEKVISISPSFMDIVDFKIRERDTNRFLQPGHVIIPRSIAGKVFPGGNAVGKIIQGQEENFIIGGIYEDFPENSFMENGVYEAIDVEQDVQSWGNSGYYMYVLLDRPESGEKLVQDFISYLPQELLADSPNWAAKRIHLTKLPEIHYTTDVQYDSGEKTSRRTLFILIAIAVVIVLIAVINFTNFSMALAPTRMKSINTHRVLGISVKRQRVLLLVEAVFISFLAYLLAVGLVHILSFTMVNEVINPDIHLFSYPGILCFTAGIAFLTGIASGLYPSLYMTSFQPAIVLNGNFGLSHAGNRVRNLLMGIQFTTSIVLITAALFMYLQNNFLQDLPLGYDKDEVIVVHANAHSITPEALTNELTSFSGIEQVAYASDMLSGADYYRGLGRSYQGQEIFFQVISVSPSFLTVMNIPVKEGRNFRDDDQEVPFGKYIFNQKAKYAFGLELNTSVSGTEIIGFVPDVLFTTYYSSPTPMAFYVPEKKEERDVFSMIYIKVTSGTDLRVARSHVEKTMKAVDEGFPFRIEFYDETINKIYVKEQNLTFVITLFSMLAILISVIGVFGLVIFECEARKKEISIRKISGSSVGEILFLFNKTYLYILGICFVVSIPVTWYTIRIWLENFAYRVPMHGWVFLVGALLVAVVTFITITTQSYKAARENPAKAFSRE